MFQRLLLIAILALAALASTEAFVVLPALSRPATTSLFGCRTNAKKEKLKRNRENMRKFSTPGRRGTSRRKILKKAQAVKERQREEEFIAKCFITGPSPNESEE
eukprot:CAMPEP_0178887300 /NCGR_PEP_ID=MMETSP0747-20121128/16509_1 /TAXON_ID=913974 /ORGANISM="Nitzschia punctata, Strain CCMP561" /LENGTH=103 /DNA_ID=CAMNT_0020556423 /DNA_START=53 /DNA_END=364 /DNA_ORIENTATION=-